MITNRLLSAQEALDWGILNQVVPADEFESAVTKLASKLAAGPTGAYGQVKKLLLMSNGAHFEAQMEAEGRAIADATRTPEGKEGIEAFLNKRKPNFRA